MKGQKKVFEASPATGLFNASRCQPHPFRVGTDSLPLPAAPAWQIERARILNRTFKCIEVRRERGQSLRKALVRFTWQWRCRNRHYRAAPNRQIRLAGAGTLRSLFYRWRRGGRCPEAVALRYKVRPLRVSPELAKRFLVECAAPGILSFAAAWRGMGPPGLDVRAVIAALPTGTRVGIRTGFHAKRRLAALGVTLGRQIRALPLTTLGRKGAEL